MSGTSRTGLVPTPKKIRRFTSKKTSSNVDSPKNFEALPLALSLRPFVGIFNPFAKGCSVLCNHPASAELKQIINHCKHSLSVEGKTVQHINETQAAQGASPLEANDNIPEDLFRRYTDTDSRPLTPTPTVASINTRTSAGSFLNNRRCITPELGKNDMIIRKKLILDLRRSHSQETLYLKPSSDLSSSLEENVKKVPSAGTVDEKKARRQKPEDQQRPKASMAAATIPEVESFDDAKKLVHTCINEHFVDEDIRRGKRRKKIKTVASSVTTFHLSEDPETQVAAICPDSLNPSTRPSLIPNTVGLLPSKEKRDTDQVLLEDSFLTDEAFQALKIKLDIDVIENTFDRCVRNKIHLFEELPCKTLLSRAYKEAFKYLPTKTKENYSIIKEMEKLNFICEKMPRKFSKSATRFDVPMSLKSLQDLSVLDYLSQYVWVSRQRKQIYKRIFLKYLKHYVDPQTEQQQPIDSEITIPLPEYKERFMNLTRLSDALKDVLEFYGTENNIKLVLHLLNYEEIIEQERDINFRSWCGIVAFAERLSLDDSSCTDSCDELEKADFNSMELRLDAIKVPVNLMRVFEIIKNTHNHGEV